MLWLARHVLSLMPTTATVRAVRSISSMMAGSFIRSSHREVSWSPTPAKNARKVLQSLVPSSPQSPVPSPQSPVPSPWSLPLHVQIVVHFGRNRRAPPLGQQVAAQKRLQVSVQHLVHIAHFHLGPVILGDAIGLQHIRANL